MNHVYRLIWNTSLGCWMVASEHTRSRGKRSSAARGLVAAAVLVLSLPVAAADALGAPAEGAVEALDESDGRSHSTAPLTVRREQIALFGNALPRSGATNAAPLAFNRSLQATVNDTYFANPTLNGENALVLGSRASVTGARSTGIGNEVVLNGGGHTALGSKATATGGRDAVAIGINATTNGTGHVAIGEAARADTNGAGVHAVAIGAKARAGSQGWTGATAVGGESVATHNGVALGYKASAQYAGAMALGFNSTASNSYANAIGYEAQAAGGSSVAIGTLAKSAGSASLAFGDRAQTSATANDSIAIGNGAQATYAQAIAIGRLAKAYGTGAVVLGNEAHALGYSNAIGHQANANNSWANAIGFQAKAIAAGSTAIGYQAEANSAATIAMGWQTKANGSHSVAIGALADVNATATDAVALGREAKVGANAVQALAVGKAAQANGEASIALGRLATANHASAIALGTQAEATGSQSLAIGLRAKANGQTAMVLGMDAQALGNYTTALGHQAKAGSAWTNAIGYQSEAMGSSSVALGTLSRSAASGSVALGDRARVDATAASSLALGHYATVDAGATNAVALGSNSVATAANTVSVGSANLKRKIVNVADGALSAASTDAVTGKQLFATNQNVTTATNTANSAKTTADAAKVDATAALTKANLVSGLIGQVSAAGNVRVGAENTGTVLDVRNKANANRAITGVADGALSAASTDAVSGKQLFATNQNVTTATNTANTAKTTADAAKVDATAALTKANLVSGLIGQVSAAGNVRVGAENTGTVLDVRNKANANRAITGVADGALSAASTEAVSGKQLFATNQNVTTATNTANTAKTTADAAKVDATAALTKANLVSGLIGQVSAAGDVRVGAENTGTVLDVRNKANAGRIVRGLADGVLSAISTDAVNGKQLFATNQNVTTATNTANTAKTTADAAKVDATAALTKANLVSGLIGQVSAAGDVRVGAENTGTVLDVRNKANAGRIVRGLADGVLSATSTDAVNGKQLFATNQNVTTATNTANTAKTTADAAKVDATAALDKATVVSGLIGQVSAAGNVRVGAENTGTVLDVRNKANANRAITGVADGVLSAASSEAVTGKQLFATNQLVNANGVAIADNRRDIGVNRDDLDTLRDEFDNYTPDLSGVVQYNADRTLVDLGGAGVTGLADGEVSATSNHAVNGSQLFGTNERVEYLEQQQRYVMVGGDEFSGPAMAGPLAVAIGSDAKAPVDGATAIGSFASAQAVNSVALGRGALVRAAAEAGFALGTNTEVAAAGGLAVGALSSVGTGANRAVALGNESVANESDTISVGNDNLKRRIVNVGRGTAEGDVTTVAQLSETLTALGGGAGLDATGHVIAPNYVLSGGEFNNVGDALTSLDTTLVSHKSELDTLDNRFQRLFQESPSASADAPGRLTLGGAQGMVLGNVANGLIGQGSRDAVNGGQLWQVKQDLQGQIDALDPNGQGGTPLAMNARSAAVASDTATPPAADAGTPPAAPDAVVTAEGDSAVAVGSEGKERTVKHVAEGRADTDAANVRQVNEAMERANEYTDAAVAGVNQRLDHMDKRINRMAAISSAQSAMAMNTAGLATTNRLGAGVGYAEGESALSVGYQRVLNERGSATFSLNGAFTNSGERSVGVGMGIGW